MDGTARYGGWLLTGTVMGMILGAGVGTLIGAAAAPWSAGSVPLLAIACAAAGMLPGANLGWRLAWRLAGRPVEPM